MVMDTKLQISEQVGKSKKINYMERLSVKKWVAFLCEKIDKYLNI